MNKTDFLKPLSGHVIAGIFALFINYGCGKKTELTKAKMGVITESVYASARIKAENQYVIFPSLNGSLSKVYVKAGDTIVSGQLLFEIDNETSSLNSENARLALELSEENAKKGSEKIKELEINLKLAKEKYELDLDLLKRQKNLWAQGVGSQTELDQKTMALDNSKSNLESAGSKLNQVKIQLDNELKKARNNYRISNKQRKDFLIRSVRQGRVFDVYKKEGEIVSPQIPLALIGDADQFIIEMEVDQTDINRVKIGQKIAISMDSYKGQIFEALVSKIYPIMEERSRTFKVEALFVKKPVSLFPNLTAEANIIILEKENAITIPRGYLIENKYVKLEDNTMKEVKTGLSDYQKVEIVSGLDTNTAIFKP